VEPVEGIDPEGVNLFLLSNIMAALLYQRGIVPFNAAAVVHNRELVLLEGEPGAGKSAIAAGLAIRGYRFFGDEICALQPAAANGVYARASGPTLNLWEDTITQLNSPLLSKTQKTRPALAKYRQRFHDHFTQEALPVRAVFLIRTKNHLQEPAIQTLHNVEAFAKLESLNHQYNYPENLKARVARFTVLSKLAAQAKFAIITRPPEAYEITSLCDIIEGVLK
jgi:serine kinase of HPr protein (carbohydrate metabolism regulator)